MRIVAGKHKGRNLAAPPGRTTRPTSIKARQAVFNKLEHGIPGFSLAGMRVADLFAGSGAFGLEALSRGVSFVTFVERDRKAVSALRANLETFGETAAAAVLTQDATRLGVADIPSDLVFIDAPYGKNYTVPAIDCLLAGNWLKPNAVVVVEIGAEEAFEPPAGLIAEDQRRYGAATIVFMRFDPAG